MSEDADDQLITRAKARVGTTLKEKWTIDKLLGVGGMAVVYRATHRNGNEVAIKMLHPELSFEPNIKERFLREGYAANKVKHSGAVAVFDDDVADDGAAFLVMELLEGETLQSRMERKGGKLPPAEVLALAEQLLAVLAAAHEKGIVHRDLKPENIFLNRDGVLKVLDFGIARLREMSGKKATATQTGSMMGTPAFMAPEQARGRWDDVDHQTDLWSAGATMFTLITGRFVHQAETLNEVLALAVTQRAPAIATIEPTVPAAIAHVVDKALAYEKTARWADANDMREAVRAAYHSTEGQDVSRAAALSLPDAARGGTLVSDASVPEVTESSVKQAVATLTTSRGVTASAPVPTTPTRATKKSPLILLLAAAGGGILLIGVVAILALSPRGDDVDPETATQAVAEPMAASAQAEPVVTPAQTATPAVDPGEVVSIDELEVAKERKKAAAIAATGGPKPDPPPQAKTKPAPPPVPAPLASPPTPAKAPPPKPEKKFDPFAKRR